MIHGICRILLAVALLLCYPGTAPTGSAAPAPAANILEVPAGGKGTSEVAALEMMKQEAVKKVLSQITKWSDDPASPYQQLLGRYREFIGKEKIRKKGSNASGYYVLGNVPVNPDKIQEEFTKLVSSERKKKEDDRTVYLLVRFLGATNATNERLAEQLILSRYNNVLRDNGFDVADMDQMLTRLPSYHGLDYDGFVNKVRGELGEEVDVTIAIVGEITQTALEEDAEGVVASCDIKVKAYDCVNNFNLITSYEGSDVIRRKTREEVGKALLEKAAIVSSKAITDRLVTYWRGQH